MIKISFLGDICLNDKYNNLYLKSIKPFNEVVKVLRKSDFVVGNLECLAKGEKGENLFKRPRLKTSLETLNYLKDLNLGLVFLANNHAYDNLEDGFVKTIKFLHRNNIAYMGAGLSRDEAEKPFFNSHNGINICILNYVTKDTNSNLPDDATIFLNFFNEEKVIADIRKYKKQVDHLVISLHWGGRVEGGLYPDITQPNLAKLLIDEGANLIIGHHSHTVQPYEIYKGKIIFYSIGNFCFSDFSFNGKNYVLPRRSRIAMIPTIYFERKRYGSNIKFFENRFDNYIKLPFYKRKIQLRNIVFKYIYSNKAGWKIYYFSKTVILPIVTYIKRNDISLVLKLKSINKGKIIHFLKKICNHEQKISS